MNSLPLKYLLLWIGSVGIVPTIYYIFGRKSDYVKNRKALIGIIFLSFYIFVFFGILLRIHLNILSIPTSIKF